MSQSVFTLYSDTSTNRHTDGFVQECSISSALAMEILQSCAKPWIWYQCICRVVCPLFIRNIFLQNIKNSLVAKRTIHGRTLGRPLDSWVAIGDVRPYFSSTVFWKKWPSRLRVNSQSSLGGFCLTTHMVVQFTLWVLFILGLLDILNHAFVKAVAVVVIALD